MYLIISLGQWVAIFRDGVRSNQLHLQTVTGNLTGDWPTRLALHAGTFPTFPIHYNPHFILNIIVIKILHWFINVSRVLMSGKRNIVILPLYLIDMLYYIKNAYMYLYCNIV